MTLKYPPDPPAEELRRRTLKHLRCLSSLDVVHSVGYAEGFLDNTDADETWEVGRCVITNISTTESKQR